MLNRRREAKLNDDLIVQIKDRVKSGETQTFVATSLGLSISCVNGAIKGRYWKHIKD
jgi:hypothetical protein